MSHRRRDRVVVGLYRVDGAALHGAEQLAGRHELIGEVEIDLHLAVRHLVERVDGRLDHVLGERGTRVGLKPPLDLRLRLRMNRRFMWIILAALCFGAVFDGLGAVRAVEGFFLERLGLGPWEVLILMQISFLLMGTFLDDTAMLVIVAPLYVPLVKVLGFDLIWYGVLYTITCQIAYMTPPFDYNLFLMRAMAPPEIGLGDIYRSIIPFVLVMVAALALVMVFPQLALWLPEQHYGKRGRRTRLVRSSTASLNRQQQRDIRFAGAPVQAATGSPARASLIALSPTVPGSPPALDAESAGPGPPPRRARIPDPTPRLVDAEEAPGQREVPLRTASVAGVEGARNLPAHVASKHGVTDAIHHRTGPPGGWRVHRGPPTGGGAPPVEEIRPAESRRPDILGCTVQGGFS